MIALWKDRFSYTYPLKAWFQNFSHKTELFYHKKIDVGKIKIGITSFPLWTFVGVTQLENLD